MTAACDFEVAVRVVESEGTTVSLDFNDVAGGLSVETVQEPEENVREIKVAAPRVNGRYRVAEADDEGELVVVVRVTAATWSECMAIWQAARTAYRAERVFYVETEIEGVTVRYEAGRPNVTPAGLESSSLLLKEQTYVLRFPVQPNPVVTIA